MCRALTNHYIAAATREEHEMYNANGPLWYRGWAQEDEAKVCADVDGVLARTGTRRMVMGHTPDFEVHPLASLPVLSDIVTEHRFKM